MEKLMVSSDQKGKTRRIIQQAATIHKINRIQFYSGIKSPILHVQHFLFKDANDNYCMQKY